MVEFLKMKQIVLNYTGKKVLVLLIAAGIVYSSYSQNDKQKLSTQQWVDIIGTIGAAQGSVAAAYGYNWRLGRNKRIEVGTGLRLTSYFGTKKDFITAGPAKYTRSFTAPFLIFFAGQNEQNFDTLQVQRAQTNSLNIVINLGYHLSAKWYAGFNIDAAGFSFGQKSGAVFKGVNAQGIAGSFTDLNSKPSSLNLLLTGDHDKGSLNSEFFVRYQYNTKWGIKAVYQFLFVEYQTSAVKQSIPNGPSIDKFRNKANAVGMGVSYSL
jgi:hypothetical protein